MVKIIIVKKNGDVKCSNVKDISFDNLHKKCLLTTNKNFDVRHVWNFNGVIFQYILKIKEKPVQKINLNYHHH